MNPTVGAVIVGLAAFGSALSAGRARSLASEARWRRLLLAPEEAPHPARSRRKESRSVDLWQPSAATERGSVLSRFNAEPRRRLALIAVLGVLGWGLGSALAPPLGGPAAAVGLALIPRGLLRRQEARRSAAVERQLADLAEASAQAMRSGLSISQALDFAHSESESPLRELLGEALARQAMGVPLDQTLQGFADAVGTDDARLLIMVFGIHTRSGGDLPGALDEVGRTIRHRIAVRRELRALSAQGRISGAILGSLPIVFFLVMSITSRRDLDPVLRSPAGILMVGGGLAMQGLAYVWIRRLLRVAV